MKAMRATTPVEKTLSAAFWLGASIFTLAALYVCSRIELDYWDAYNFLLQARRLTDSDFHFVELESQRPRALVILLTLFNFVYKTVSGAYPSIKGYHVLLTVVAVLYVLVWRKVLQKIFDRKVADLTALFLVCCQMLLHYAMMVLTDILSGLLWGLTLLAFCSWWGALKSENSKTRWRLTFGLALSGALLGLSKHHLLPVLPAMLILSVVLLLREKQPKSILRFVALVGLFYLGFLEGLVRFFGDPHQGLYHQLLSIYHQAKDSAGISSSRWMFTKNFYLMYGAPFLIWGMAAFLLCRRQMKRPQAAGWQLLAVTFVFGGLCQIYPYRETRYLFPFLPTLLSLFAWGGVRAYEGLQIKSHRTAWVFAGMLTLAWPVSRSYQELKVFLNDKVYLTGEMGFSEFYSQLRQPSRKGKVCDRLEMCWFAVGTQNPVAMEYDPYYAGFDIGPQIIYEARIPVTTRPCNTLSPSHLETLKQVTPHLSEFNCYAVREERTAPYRQDSLILLKPYSFAVSENQSKQFMAMRQLSSGFDAFRCEQLEKERYACFETQRFFGR